MENPILEAKKELIQWIKEMDELEDIVELLKIKNRKKSVYQVAEPQTEYAVKDDFDERFAKGLTSEESRRRTREFIERLPWKK
ncbi:hypothetical protein [Chryseobacterium sp. NKUCC03_KSP]|uniref:hypothetical protein n=1 Tax=Chryseobacterium sp. NKUCC03_KSP TaxID=2842125 RepID=UPI001C5AA0E5|nr:hypothetical protein [Chryseobacterium sp. NKUCC03_KSP]MBW3523512.1 hypothetical protein [Chryseobacterium sp. NKUCC03_KSP]